MKIFLQHLFGSVLGVLTLGISPSFAQQQLPEPSTVDSNSRAAQASYGRLPLIFEANAGQTARDVKFLAHGPGYTVFLTSGQMVLSLRPSAGTAHGHKTAPAVIRLNLVDGNPNPAIAGENSQPTRVNYFIGNDPTKWRKNVPTYKQVRYRNIYPGIDLLYYGRQSHVEHDFVVAPGADPAQIQFDVDGADQLSLAPNGDLVLTKNNDEIRLQAPQAYQQLHGMTVPIAAQYSINSTRVSFTTGEYDKASPLVIDPVLVYSTYLGGSADDVAVAIQVDTLGNAYLAGYSDSTDFPGTSQNGPAPSGMNAFVAELDVTGSTLLYADYIGGSGDDYAYAMTMDASDNIFITGNTGSTDFPTVNPFQAQNTGGQSAFVTEIAAGGASLTYSTYLGGSAFSQGNAIGLDGTGDIYVGGSTYAVDFPTANAYQAAVAANQNGSYGQYGFLTEFTANGSSLVYSTYMGGNSNVGQSCESGLCWPSPYSSVTSIAVDSGGDAYVTGGTNTYNFPTTTGSYQSSNSTSWNQDVGFFGKFNPSGTISYSSYYGAVAGTYNELYPSAIVVDSTGSVYLAGSALPEYNPIPITTPNICNPQTSACDPGFLTKFDSTGATVVYSTYLSSGISAVPYSLAVDALGDAYVSSVALDGWISLTNPIENYAGGRDLYIQEIDPTGGTILFSSFMGGSGDDYPGGMAVDTIGDIYITGYTYSSDYPVTLAAFQTALAGQINVFVSKIGADSVPAVTLTAPSVQNPIASVGSASPSDTVVLRNMGSSPLTISRITMSGPFSETDTCGQGVGAADTCTLAVTFTPTQPGLQLGSMVIEDNAPGSPHVVNLTGVGTSGVAQTSTSALSFSPLTVGTSSTPQSITITNAGNAPLTIDSIQTTGDFSESNNCSSLAPNGTCSIKVTFTPTVSGTHAGTLIITDSAANSPQSIMLTGVGTTPTELSGQGKKVSQPESPELSN